MPDGLQLGSIDIELGTGVTLLIWQDRVPEPDTGFDVTKSPGPPLRFRGKLHKGNDESVPIVYSSANPSSGVQALILFENTGYNWKLRGPAAGSLDPAAIQSTLKADGEGPRKAEWIQTRLSGDSPGGFFKVTNYLGTAEIRVAPSLPIVRFEIQSRKFDFHGEYRAMVEDIASHCQQLLLEWESPTSFNIAPDPARRRKILLEQFLFLRHVLGGDKLDLYLEEIRRRPHVALDAELEWKPSSLARSARFATDPIRHGRTWQLVSQGRICALGGIGPGEILHERRFDTFDTPPNRFIHFALAAFRDVCEEVMAAFAAKHGTAWLEAGQMRNSLDVFLAQPFFADVSRLDRLPLENQTLQKREGYRDILLAWLMLETASRIDWPGRDDAYDGTNRNAATLYEFWLYFMLRGGLIKRLGMDEIGVRRKEEDEEKHFLSTSSTGVLQLNLAQNKESISRFRWTSHNGEQLGVHLFYNRSFEGSRDPMGGGTYSQRFRPDFTIVFFPAEYLNAGKWSNVEQLAQDAGHIGFLHFDAKYRIEDLGKIFGEDNDDALSLEKNQAKGTDTYRRGDLYKMHAYNDAIRRTAGSYVLYPGRDGEPRKSFPRYEEVIPGVGAFRLRPGDNERREICEQALADFICEVLNHHVNTFSRDYRIRHWTHKTLRESAAIYAEKKAPKAPTKEPPADTKVLLAGYRSRELTKLGRKKRFVYFHAIDSTGHPTTIHPDKLAASVVVPYFKGRTGWKWSGWQAQASICSLVSRQELVDKYLGDQALLESGTQFYYVVDLDNLAVLGRSKLRTVGEILAKPAFPKICNWADLCAE
jgi:predicted component of viral defense system (DUF524 family)